MLQLDLPLNTTGDYKIKVSKKIVNEAINEVSKEMGIQGELPLSTVFNTIKSELETQKKPGTPKKFINSKGNQIEIELSDTNVTNNKSTEKATGDKLNTTKKNKIKRAKELNKDKPISEHDAVDINKDNVNERLRRAIREGDLDGFNDAISRLQFRDGDKAIDLTVELGKSANQFKIRRNIRGQIKKVIDVIKNSKEIARSANKELAKVLALGKGKNASPKNKELLKKIRKAETIEKRIMNQYTELLEKISDPIHTGNKLDFNSINILRKKKMVNKFVSNDNEQQQKQQQQQQNFSSYRSP